MEPMSLEQSPALLAVPNLPNASRTRQRGALKFAAISGILGASSLLLALALVPECKDRTPRKTSAGRPCMYGWSWHNFTCDTYCCNPDEDPDGDWCVFTCFEETCYRNSCAQPQSQVDYVLDELWSMTNFLVIYSFVMLLFYARACCKSSWYARWIMCKTIGMTCFAGGIMFLGYALYLGTDCRNSFAGVSDVLLAASFPACLYSAISFVRAAMMQKEVMQFDRLLALVASAAAGGDEEVLFLDVGQESLERFWQRQLEEERHFSITQTDSGCCGKKYRGFCCCLLLIAGISNIAFVFTSRETCFFSALGFQIFFPLVLFYVAKSSYLRQLLYRRQVAARLANLPRRETVILFHNSERLVEHGDAASFDVGLMSAAFFSGNNGLVLFHPPREGTLLATSVTTTNIIETEGACSIRFTTTYRAQRTTLFQSVQAEVEVPQNFPIEAGDVQRARDWLQRRSEVFGMQPSGVTAGDV
eukprot:TRINITY_DN63459_c0_g1_i1.p1 TRINITY_DN63459_c0_g1~~TRINITY_DN63459_c0_g1_i1.p1  ORF type:complete len:474 (-),score=54.40 TRINITY_DN63459_c0_g1_i1:98-1519(-)